MDENNEQKQPTKQEKAEQAGKDVAEVAAKGAANYFGGPVGGAIADKIAQTKLGQNVLNKAGKSIAKNPVAKNALAKSQPAIEKAKPMLNQAAGSLGGNAGGAAENATQTASSSNNQPTNSNPSTSSSSSSNNSGFGNNKSGLFSPRKASSEEQSGSVTGGLGESLKKAKKTIGIISAIAPIVLPMILGIILVAVVMAQIMTIRDNITQLANQFTTGVEKFINFSQGNGWMTNEAYFFRYLDQEYNKFSIVSGGSKLDVPLVAATIHYSNFVDFEQYEDTNANIDNLTDDDLNSLGNGFTKDQTAAFYNVAKEKLGSVNTKALGQKRLLGHLTRTKFKVGTYKLADAVSYNAQFLAHVSQVVFSSLEDMIDVSGLAFDLAPISSLLTLHERLAYYVETTGDITYETNYDVQNFLYDIEEILSQIGIDSSDSDSYIRAIEFDSKLAQTDDGQVEDSDKGIWLAIKLERISNYGYAEYKQMNQDLANIKSMLKRSNISFDSDTDALSKAERSSVTEIKERYNSYKTNEEDYRYSYTHYLQNVYIPFTYFYNKEYNQQQIDSIVDEIYDQRDFYYYLIGEDTTNYSCGGSCTYPVNGEEISNLKVRLLQCSDGDVGQPIKGEELVDFEKYILGVVYAEIGLDAPAEAAKAQAIAARSYALTRAKQMGNAHGLKLEKEGDNWILSIRNCTADQVYCDPDKGCSNTTNPSESGNSTTVYSGVETKQYKYKDPLPEDAQIRTAVSSVTGQVLLDEDGEIVATGYTNTDQNNWKEQAEKGKDYTEILLERYKNGSSISTSLCNNVCNKATGDYTQWKQLASLGAPWADVVIGNGKTINQIGCLATSVSIQIARSGVPLQNINGEFNPGTFVEGIKPNGFVTSGGQPGGTLFVWNSTTIVAPTFQYSHSVILSGLTETQKAAQVQSLINQGCYVVMEVKGNGGGEHYVAIDYVQGSEVYMMDPASTEVVTWNLYPHHWTTGAYCYKVTG